MKKLISVLLCVALMFTFLTVISSAEDAATAADGAETIFNIIVKLLSSADWAKVMTIVMQTIQTFLRIIGAV